VGLGTVVLSSATLLLEVEAEEGASGLISLEAADTRRVESSTSGCKLPRRDRLLQFVESLDAEYIVAIEIQNEVALSSGLLDDRGGFALISRFDPIPEYLTYNDAQTDA
jgi:hypothetical protein